MVKISKLEDNIDVMVTKAGVVVVAQATGLFSAQSNLYSVRRIGFMQERIVLAPHDKGETCVMLGTPGMLGAQW